MSTYRIVYRKQDLGLRLSSLYRQQQLSIGILDLGSREELVEAIEWYLENMNNSIHVMTTEDAIEKDDITSKYPEVTFIIFKNATTSGEYINSFADQCYATYFLVVRTDCALISFDGSQLMSIMGEKNHPAMITPVMLSSDGKVLPSIRVPHLRGKDVDPLSFLPENQTDPVFLTDKCTNNLYPLMEIGLYDRALFQRLREYDTEIAGEYFQALDYGLRCYLMGYSIVTTRALAILFPQRIMIIEDRSECYGMNRFYTKALSIRKIAGKNVAEKWKPYVDKKVFNDEVKKKLINLQKTDFKTLMENWS